MKRLIAWLISVGLVAGGGLWWWTHREAIQPEAIRLWIDPFGALGPLVYVVLYALNTVTLVPPIAIVSLSAGLAFGPVIGFLAIMAGAMIGTSATFWISRRLGRGFVERRLKEKFQSLDAQLGQRGFLTVLFFRLVPIVPYEVLNYASGLSRVRFGDYALATCLGIVPGAAVAAWFGNSLTQPFSWKFLFGLAALAILIVVPIIYVRLRRSQ